MGQGNGPPPGADEHGTDLHSVEDTTPGRRGTMPEDNRMPEHMDDAPLALRHEKEVQEGYAWICDHCGAKYRKGEIFPAPTLLERIYQDAALCPQCKSICRDWELLNRRARLKMEKMARKARDKKVMILVSVGAVLLFFIYPGFLTYGMGLMALFFFGLLKYGPLPSKMISLTLFGAVWLISLFVQIGGGKDLGLYLLAILSCVLCVMIPVMRKIWEGEQF